jgi:SAM-dependent methyltransferase
MRINDDSERLKREQYNNVDKLAARIRLHEQFSTSQVNLFDWIFDHLLTETPPDASVLEIGCGRGDLWKRNFEHIPSGWTIKLTDFSPGMLDDCKHHLGEEAASRFEFRAVDAQAIPYPDGEFDMLIADFMLYHVPNREEAIREFRRVLKPSGKLFAMTVGEAHLSELLDILHQFEADASQDFAASAFTLQNGAEQLGLCFPEVELEPFEDSLYVTELQPLLDYIASAISLWGFSPLHERTQTLIAALDDQLRRDGGISIQKQIGLFTASGLQ